MSKRSKRKGNPAVEVNRARDAQLRADQTLDHRDVRLRLGRELGNVKPAPTIKSKRRR